MPALSVPIPTLDTIKALPVTQIMEVIELLCEEVHARQQELPVPEWHICELQKRVAAAANGEGGWTNWEDARERILARTEQRANG